MKYISDIGQYFMLMKEVFKKPQNKRLYKNQLIFELQTLGIESLLIVAIVSIFVGAAVVIQLAANLDNPIYPTWVNGFASRKTIVLEFSPTIISLILAGKVGSRIASELGSMRISEQVEALDVMGVNSASYLILPKIVACVMFSPLIIVISVFLSLTGGAMAGSLTGMVSLYSFVDGLQMDFNSFDIIYAIIKGLVFSFIIASISSYRGYTVSGGALQVGQASTKAVVQSSMVLIVFNLVLTKLLL